MSAYKADITVTLRVGSAVIRVHLSRGGDQFPWAVHKGRVIIGPADGSNTSDGTPLETLVWHTNKFWIIEALNEQNEAVTLTPEQHQQVLEKAEKNPLMKLLDIWEAD